MLSDIREKDLCFSDSDLEVETYDQVWDKESLKELRDMEIFFMSNNKDSVTPIKLHKNSKGIPNLITIGIEDDGTLFFGGRSSITMSVSWIDSLINELRAVKKYVEKLN